jgi:hypothetical protein
MKRKGFILLLLAALVAGAAFAQKVGDTVDVTTGMNGQWTVREIKGDTMVLQRSDLGLNGTYSGARGLRFTITGTGGVVDRFDTSGLVFNNQFWKIGDAIIRNLQSTGNNAWSCEMFIVNEAKDTNTSSQTITGRSWKKANITTSNGRSFRFSAADRSWYYDFNKQ